MNVIEFRALPLGSNGSRAALVEWSDGSVSEALRRDFIARYRDNGMAPVMTDYEDAIPTPNLPDSSPTVLWATTPPPVKPLAVPSGTGPNAQEDWH